MSYGKLGSGLTTANGTNIIYTVPAGALFATVNINVSNPGGTDAVVNLYIASADTPTPQDLIEGGTTLIAGGVLERTGMICSPGERIIVKSPVAGLAVRVSGFEET